MKLNKLQICVLAAAVIGMSACDDKAGESKTVCTNSCKDATTQITCDANGNKIENVCDNGCSNGACNASPATETVVNKCTANACKADNKTLLECNTTTGIITERVCDNGCYGGQCSDIKPQGEVQKCASNTCKDNMLLKCDTESGYYIAETCDLGCEAGACKTDGNEPQACTVSSCNTDGSANYCDPESGKIIKLNCKNGCENGFCLPQGNIDPGTYHTTSKCKDNVTLVTTSTDPSVKDAETVCDFGCDMAANACRGLDGMPCEDSNGFCLDNEVYACNWVKVDDVTKYNDVIYRIDRDEEKSITGRVKMFVHSESCGENTCVTNSEKAYCQVACSRAEEDMERTACNGDRIDIYRCRMDDHAQWIYSSYDWDYCDGGCKDGKCINGGNNPSDVGDPCDDSFKPRCEKDTAVACVEGTVRALTCGDGHICVTGPAENLIGETLSYWNNNNNNNNNDKPDTPIDIKPENQINTIYVTKDQAACVETCDKDDEGVVIGEYVDYDIRKSVTISCAAIDSTGNTPIKIASEIGYCREDENGKCENNETGENLQDGDNCNSYLFKPHCDDKVLVSCDYGDVYYQTCEAGCFIEKSTGLAACYNQKCNVNGDYSVCSTDDYGDNYEVTYSCIEGADGGKYAVESHNTYCEIGCDPNGKKCAKHVSDEGDPCDPETFTPRRENNIKVYCQDNEVRVYECYSDALCTVYNNEAYCAGKSECSPSDNRISCKDKVYAYDICINSEDGKTYQFEDYFYCQYECSEDKGCVTPDFGGVTPGDKCDKTFVDSCKDNIAVYCQGGEVHIDVCDGGTECANLEGYGAKCISKENKCADDAKQYDEINVCSGNTIENAVCLKNKDDNNYYYLTTTSIDYCDYGCNKDTAQCIVPKEGDSCDTDRVSSACDGVNVLLTCEEGKWSASKCGSDQYCSPNEKRCVYECSKDDHYAEEHIYACGIDDKYFYSSYIYDSELLPSLVTRVRCYREHISDNNYDKDGEERYYWYSYLEETCSGKCIEGECEYVEPDPNEGCGNFMSYCDGNSIVKCENGQTVEQDCDGECISDEDGAFCV